MVKYKYFRKCNTFMPKLFGGRTFLVDCLLARLGWNWFCRVRVEVLIKWPGGV
jgi:hypothetical protein